MKCPKCGHANPDGTVICAKCDAILDKSFLGDDFTDAEPAQPGASPPPVPTSEGDTAIGGAPKPPRRRRPSPQEPDPSEDPTDRGATHKKPPPKPSLSTAQTAPKAAPSSTEPTAAKAKRTAQDTPEEHSFAPQDQESLRSEGARMAKDVEGTLKKMWAFFQGLRLPDKLTLGGAVLTFVFIFFPWVRIPPIEAFTGFELGGWFAALLAAGAGAMVYMRHQEEWKSRARYLFYAQAGCAAVCLLFMLTKMGTARNVQVSGSEMGIQDVQPPMIQVGLVFCFIAVVAILAGTLMLYKEFIGKKPE